MDVWLETIIMKGTACYSPLLPCISSQEEQAAEIILKGTTTLGLRRSEVDRIKLRHHITPMETTFGLVRSKKPGGTRFAPIQSGKTQTNFERNWHSLNEPAGRSAASTKKWVIHSADQQRKM